VQAIARYRLAAWLSWESRGKRSLFEQSLVLAGKIAPIAQSIEAVSMAVLVDHGRERADLFEAFGRRHVETEIGPQPAIIIETVLSDDAYLARELRSQPSYDLLAVEVCAIGMA
jgi:hypothetical protein